MVRIHPFEAIRPQPEFARDVASVPYDVVNTAEAKVLAAGNPYSFLHVVRPEIDLPDGTDVHDDAVYRQAKTAFDALQSRGVVLRESKPSLYLYRQQMELLGRQVEQTGLVACCHIDDYNQDRIKKHEKTRKDKEDDRTRHVLAINANAGPVFLLHKDDERLAALSKQGQQNPPLYDFTAVDGVRHTVWTVEENQPWIDAFAQHAVVYVADGHHRSASAARAGLQKQGENKNHRGDEEYNWFLAVLFPAQALTILPYHRLVQDLNGLSSAAFLAKLAEVGDLQATQQPDPPQTGSFGIYVDGHWYRLTLAPESIDHSDAIGSLDYVLLADRVLSPILGIGDLRTDKRIDFVGGIRGTKELERRVNDGSMAVAFAMHATTIEQLIAVADGGLIMPPKSTWFEPKLRSGLLVHSL